MKLKLNKEQFAVINAFLINVRLGDTNKYESAISDLCVKYDDRLMNQEDLPSIVLEKDDNGDPMFVIKE